MFCPPVPPNRGCLNTVRFIVTKFPDTPFTHFIKKIMRFITAGATFLQYFCNTIITKNKVVLPSFCFISKDSPCT